MRLDYLNFILAFGVAGGLISRFVAHQALDVLKGLLKDWSESNFDVLTTFLGSFVQMLLDREDPPSPKFDVAFLHDLSPIPQAYMAVMDLTGVLEAIGNVRLCQRHHVLPGGHFGDLYCRVSSM